MKTLATLLLLCVTIGVANAQSWSKNLGINYAFTNPTGGMKQYIRYGNGVSLSYMAEEPLHRLAVGLELNWTGYGHSKKQENYTFPDGTVAPMNIVVNNSIITVMATSRLYLLINRPIQPYATLKAGYSLFRTQLQILDPNDKDSCEPVESHILSNDGTMVYSAGGGVRIDLGWLFKRERAKYYIDFGSTMIQGGRVSYMNENPPDPNTSHAGMSTRVKEVTAQFINTQTQVVHSHHVGYLYNSFVQMMDFRLGLTINLGERGFARL